MTLSYEDIFSRYRGITDDPKELSLNLDDQYEIYTERLHMVIADPRVIAKFSTIVLDDDIQEMEFELKYPVSEFADSEFIMKLLSLGMAIEWLKPQVDSRIYTSQFIGGKEEKMLQNNYKPMKERLESMERQFSRWLGSYGYINNSYIRGES